jgi:3-phenylpropionate/cinnamic acid dioxygenase small subunit
VDPGGSGAYQSDDPVALIVIHAAGTSVDDVILKHDIEETLFREAALLDAYDYRAWLEMLTDDIIYWMPIRSTRTTDDKASEFTAYGEGAFFDDDRRALELRVEKHFSGSAWAEDPPSRTRHCIFNIRILEKHAGDEVTVASNTIVYRSRLDDDENWWVGRRVDRLRRVDGRWRIARREIYLDQTVLTTKNLSTFL